MISMAAIRSRLCGAGERWQWDGVSFEFLYPEPADYNNPDAKDNDHSCVLRIVSPYGSVLLPGDIEKQSEFRMLQSSANLQADVLIAPHHGSRTSSTPDFVQAVAPGLTVFSVGYRNRFGHPHPAVSARYRQAGSRMLRTDIAGALLIGMHPTGVEVQRWREVDRKYWAGR
jgi:competence protein ComEC